MHQALAGLQQLCLVAHNSDTYAVLNEVHFRPHKPTDKQPLYLHEVSQYRRMSDALLRGVSCAQTRSCFATFIVARATSLPGVARHARQCRSFAGPQGRSHCARGVNSLARFNSDQWTITVPR